MSSKINRAIVFLSFLLCIIGISCNKEEPIPSYIRIDKIDLTTNYSTEGSNSHKILDAWVYIDDNPVGTFEMPCTFPVLYAGSHNIKIFPGIKENGITETRIAYPFYDKYETDVTLAQGQITTIAPAVKYVQGATFQWIEDFEGVAHGVCKSDGTTKDSVMTITSTSSEIFEGTGSGKVEIFGGTYFGMTCNKYSLPKSGASVFLEMNYNCNTEFNVGVAGYTASGTLEMQQIAITLNPTSGWNKIYINLSSEVTNATNSTKFAVFFSMIKNSSLSSSYFYLDNVKLIN